MGAPRAAWLPPTRALTSQRNVSTYTYTNIYNLNLTKPINVIFKVKFRLKCISTATMEVFYLAQIRHTPSDRRC